MVIRHLREQQARLEVEAEAASVLRIKQTRLEETLKSVNIELREAKKSHTPVSYLGLHLNNDLREAQKFHTSLKHIHIASHLNDLKEAKSLILL